MPGGLILCGGGRGEHPVACNVLGVEVAAFRAHHDGHVANRNARFGRRRNAVSLDGEVNGDG